MSSLVRVSDVVKAAILERCKGGESIDSCLRRVFDLEPIEKRPVKQKEPGVPGRPLIWPFRDMAVGEHADFDMSLPTYNYLALSAALNHARRKTGHKYSEGNVGRTWRVTRFQ